MRPDGHLLNRAAPTSKDEDNLGVVHAPDDGAGVQMRSTVQHASIDLANTRRDRWGGNTHQATSNASARVWAWGHRGEWVRWPLLSEQRGRER